MEVTVRDVVIAQSVITTVGNIKLPGKQAWWFQKWIRRIDQEWRDYDRTRQVLVERFGEKQDDGNTIVPPEKREQFTKEIETLFEQKVEFDVPQIDLDVLKDVEIEIRTLAALWFIFKEDNV